MSATTLRLPGTLAEIEASPTGNTVGAFFDLDGTLIAGYSAQFLATQRMKDRDLNLRELARTVGVMASGQLGVESFEQLLTIGAQSWAGRAQEDIDEMGLRLFQTKVADQIYPEMKEIVAAHKRQGHTVVLTSSATSMQVEPVAAYLGIDNIVCNHFSVQDGVLTGEIEHPVVYGPGKSDAVQIFAAEHGLELNSCYFYADGDEDRPLMYLVGEPRPTNPGPALEKVAKQRGWPVLRFESRGATSALRSLTAVMSLLPIAAGGISIGLAKRNRRDAMNFVSQRWVDTMLKVNDVNLNVVGEENAWAARPAVFVFNHRNGFDPFIATKIVRRDFTAVAKAELRNDPFVGTLGRLLDVAFVDRTSTTSAVEALQPIQEMAAKGLSVIIAPEGTRLDTTGVGPFKKGAFRIAMAAGTPIVPIVIRNAELIGGLNARAFNPGTVDVAVLPPIPTKDWKLDDLDEHIAEVRQQFLDTLADWPTAG